MANTLGTVTPEQRTLLLLAQEIDRIQHDLDIARHIHATAVGQLEEVRAAVKRLNDQEAWISEYRDHTESPAAYKDLPT